MSYIGHIFLLGRAFMWSKPSIIWKITKSWKSYDATEPSDFFNPLRSHYI
ncbi:DUF6199 family natural product biosynthesis protein [Lederbergia panacisoli]